LDEEDFGEKEKINKRKMFILEGIVSTDWLIYIFRIFIYQLIIYMKDVDKLDKENVKMKKQRKIERSIQNDEKLKKLKDSKDS